MIDVYVFVLYNILLVIFLTLFITMRKRYKAIILSVAQLVIDKGILMDRLDKIELENSKEANEGFIKFLSQSRDAAFKYIEDVQLSIQNYINAIDSKDEDAIKIARIELFSHLPESTETGK